MMHNEETERIQLQKIFELSSHVADLIAAGEVVERPASVVKELLENAIDAGAGIITVEIQGGGMTYIRVTDNGCGIAPDDAKTAFLRHATSKLRHAEGLEAIATLGFRGEALAAISAVSRIELLSREPGADEGVSLSLEAGAVTDISPAGCPEGTTMIVRDLFFNTPARLKFMKSDRAESSAISSAVVRCALSRPDVSIRFIRDGKTECHTPGDSRTDSCIYSLLGREFSAGLIPAESSDGAVSVSGFVSSPAAARGNRNYQFFFVNGRTIQSRTLQAALEQAYSNTIMSGRFPSCALYIRINYASVDVNVHPAKTEVKFVSDKQVFDGVYYATLGAISARSAQDSGLRGQGSGDRGYENNAELGDGHQGIKFPSGEGWPQSGRGGSLPAGRGFKTVQADEFRRKYGGEAEIPRNAPFAHEGGGPQGRGLSPNSPLWRGDREADGLISTGNNLSVHDVAEPFNSQLGNGVPLFRVVGEVLKTYIIVEYRENVWFIDKHAVHERIHFDALKSSKAKQMSQALLTPVICRFGQEEAAILLDNAEFLENLGFLAESFGDGAVAVRSVPAEIDIADAESALSEICAQLRLGGEPSPVHRDEIYRTIACKAAIKAGKSSDIREMEALAARVFSGEVAQCPHGRPVAFEVAKTTLERWFKRA